MSRPAMVFAAGHGTRMGALTRDRPKPLLPLGGRTLLDHALTQLRGAGAGPVVVNTHAHADQMARHLATQQDVQIVHEPDLLETGGGLRAALPLLGDGPVYTLNSDAGWRGPNPFDALEAGWRDHMGALLLLVPKDRSFGHAGNGSFRLAGDGRIARPGPLIYTGAQIVDPAGLAAIPDPAFSLTVHWEALARQGRLYGTIYQGHWADAGTPEGLAAAEALIEADDVSTL